MRTIVNVDAPISAYGKRQVFFLDRAECVRRNYVNSKRQVRTVSNG